jgi:nucleoside phosphorylase
MAKQGEVLLVAATDIELCDHAGIACGVGPVEAAAETARALALQKPAVVIHVGIAGGRGITPGALVVGSESVYCDISAAIPVIDRVKPDPDLFEAVRAVFPDALALPIGTSASVGGVTSGGLRVEAMEGFAVLRACAHAETPAIELRAISNEISESDRGRWRIGRALETLADAIPLVLEAAAQ